MDLEYDHDFLSMEMEVQGGYGVVRPGGETAMGLLVHREDLFSDSQLVELVNNPTQDPMVCPARDAETEEALQPGDFSWIEEVKVQDAALLEQSLEVQQG